LIYQIQTEARDLVTFFSQHLRLRAHAMEESADLIEIKESQP
jgi:hypothetical protein